MPNKLTKKLTFGGLILLFVLSVFGILGYYSSKGFTKPNIVSISSLPKAYVVQSGSMEPTLKTGSLVFTYPSDTYTKGDIVTFKINAESETPTTHRIEARLFPDGIEAEPTFLTSGDANDSIDGTSIKNENIIGKVFFNIPYLGYVADFAKKPYGFILLVIVPATIIIYEELRNLLKEIGKRTKKIRTEKENRSELSENQREPLPKVSVFVPIFGAFLVATTFAGSYFLDADLSNGNTLQAAAEFPISAPVQVADHVVISEVQTSESGPGNTVHDFIELFNPTSDPIDLNGHRLVKRTGSSPNDVSIKSWITSAIIPAHGFYLWASSDDGYATAIGADTATGENIAAENSIALRFGAENTGVIIDALSWSSAAAALKEGSEFSPDPGDNQSMERKAYSSSTQATMEGGADSTKGNGFDSNNNSTDFILRSVSNPQNSSSPTETP